MEYLLKYLGKKAPVKIDRFGLTFGVDPVWVQDAQFQWLTSVNPRMFQKLAERNEPEEEVEVPILVEPEPIPEVEEAPNYGVCEKCGQAFKVKWTYDRHIKRCTGPEQ